MGIEGFGYKNASEIHREISLFLPDFQNFKNPKRQAQQPKIEGSFNPIKPVASKLKKSNKIYPFLLSTSNIEHTYRSIPFTDWVKGAKKIFPDRTLEINPVDARKFHIEDGEEVVVSSNGFEKIWPVRIAPEISSGMLHITLPQAEIIGSNPHPVKIRKKNV
jgi:anaerobic selenocysteine-containing dehydrogenase